MQIVDPSAVLGVSPQAEIDRAFDENWEDIAGLGTSFQQRYFQQVNSFHGQNTSIGLNAQMQFGQSLPRRVKRLTGRVYVLFVEKSRAIDVDADKPPTDWIDLGERARVKITSLKVLTNPTRVELSITGESPSASLFGMDHNQIRGTAPATMVSRIVMLDEKDQEVIHQGGGGGANNRRDNNGPFISNANYSMHFPRADVKLKKLRLVIAEQIRIAPVPFEIRDMVWPKVE
jgi:hypothetical protein